MLLPLNDIGMIRNTLACLVAEAGVADVPVRLRQGPPYQAMPLAGIRRGRNEWRRGQRDGGLTSRARSSTAPVHPTDRRHSGTIDLAVRRQITFVLTDGSSRRRGGIWPRVDAWSALAMASLGYAPDRVRDSARAPAGYD